MNIIENQMSNGIGGYTPKKSTSSSNSRTSGVRRSSNKKVKKKRLNYNHREISAQIMRASKAKNAATVLASARVKLSSLRRCQGTGMYNEQELSNAILHARRMEQCADKKVRNLKEEEMEKKKMERKADVEGVRRKVEVRHEIARKEQQLMQEIQQKKLEQVQKEKREWQELKLKEKTNRNRERGKINEANMEYLKGKISIMKEQGYSADSSEILSLKASLDELNREKIAIQSGQELDGVYSEGVSSSGAADMVSEAAIEADAAPAVGSMVDISL